LTPSGSRASRLLIAHRHLPSLESLIRTFDDRQLRIEYEVSTSVRSAERKLRTTPYQLIISDAQLADQEEGVLLQRAQTLRPGVPVVVTADAAGQDAARRTLLHGAFDLITLPLDRAKRQDYSVGSVAE